MSKEQINEISKYKLRQYLKAAPKKIGNLAYNVGLRGGDKNDPDAKKAEKHATGIKKAGERLQGYYRPKHVRERNPRYGGVRKYEGAYSSHKFYKPNAEDESKAAAKRAEGKYGRKDWTAQGEVPWNYKDMGDRERYPRKKGRTSPYRANEEVEQLVLDAIKTMIKEHRNNA